MKLDLVNLTDSRHLVRLQEKTNEAKIIVLVLFLKLVPGCQTSLASLFVTKLLKTDKISSRYLCVEVQAWCQDVEPHGLFYA